MLAFITWDVSPIIAEIGPLTLRWYGLLFASGFIIGSFILSHVYKSERVSPHWVDVITVYMLIGTVLGARLGHVFFYDWESYRNNPGEILKIWHGGLASHGATLGILLATWLFSRNNKFDYLWVLDRIVLVVAVGGALIRLGNLMNSEIVGLPTQQPWGFVFVRDAEKLEPATRPLPSGAVLVERSRDASGDVVRPVDINTPVGAGTLMAVPRHPSQIYESLFCVFLFVLLYRLWSRYKENTPRGLLFGLFVVLLFSFRFLVEFVKEDQVDFEKGMALNMGQILSIPLVLVGLWVLFTARNRPGTPQDAPRDLTDAEPPKPLSVQTQKR
ncbi:prolipoprotein diacylglyceryl transferase [Hymenobacter sp. CRA2]|uniref:prolipoprotein diacylglyceryl transferase n=1 Tax=Hymenobacter sp. CRA2 TaxID=1955620 RepID=UPI00098FC229|nr:prolipoprotein diacylglyceryl transferase [Hymenobacter sp. CRA2]OON67370.1 prolipoprotein diacylglyceryl transferase [Hymenobacter sp. CRA2]